jgi:hypothetical protein
MTTFTLNGFIARETDKAWAVVILGEHRGDEVKALWMPKAKATMSETDGLGVRVCLKGETIARMATPATFEVDAAFMGKVRPDLMQAAA